MKKLATAKEIICLMRDGWELGLDGTLNGGWRIQKNGLGRGGEVKCIHASTADAMYRRHWIRQKKYGFPESIYELTEEAPLEAAP